MIALGGSVALPTNADTYVEPYSFTPAQTLALYGDTIEGEYLNDSGTWENCTFQYFGTVRGFTPTPYGYESGTNANWDFRGAQPSGYTDWSDFMSKRFATSSSSGFIVYRCAAANMHPDTVLPRNNVVLHLNPSIEIAGIKFFDQIFAMSKPAPQLPYTSAQIDFTPPVNVDYLSTTITNRTIPAVSYARGWQMFDSVTRSWGWFRTNYLQNDEYGSVQAVQPIYYNLIRTYIEVLQDGIQQPFNVNKQSLNYSVPHAWSVTSGGGGTSYFLFVGCPIVTDGFVIPSTDTDLTLSEINANTDKIVTQLDIVIQKLNDIIAKMQTLNPTLTPAQTLPRDLESIYSGINSGIPDSGALQDSARGMAIVPFSDILSISGLGSTFGLLVGLCCAGWVLTRGRGG